MKEYGYARKSRQKQSIDRQVRNIKALYIYYFAWLYSNKGVILGRLLGQSLRSQEIPRAFVKVIEAAGKLAKV